MSTINRIPLMYHPTNVVLLDDDPKFLHNLCMNLELTIPYVTETDPEKIMEYLRKHTYKQDILSALVIKQKFDGSDIAPGAPETFSVDFSGLLSTLNTPDRFKKSVYGMFDRAMKKMDGIDFCRSIREKDIPIKIHLFTGKTSSEEAIQFFNQKIIDGFLIKNSNVAKLATEVNAIIHEYTWRQFVELGEKLSGLLSHFFKPLQDEQFMNVFMQTYKKNKIIEFYIMDSSCSFMMIDQDGRVKQFFVRNEQDFRDCADIAEDAQVSRQVLQSIRDRQQFPHTKKSAGYVDLKNNQWESKMISMDKVPGRELYYAMVDRPDIEVFSFHRYMQEEWPRA